MTFYPPMLANPIDIDKVQDLIDRGFQVEPKIDGVRCIIKKRGNNVQAWTRSGKELTGKLEMMLLNASDRMSFDFVFDGELGYYNGDHIYPQVDFNKTMRVIGSGVDEALRKQEEYANNGEWLELYIFDVLSLEGVQFIDVEQYLRRGILETMRDRIEYNDLFHVMPTMPSSDALDYYNDYVRRGGEGIILKNPDASYYPGKRKAQTWYKLKAYETIDAKIVGFDPGQGKYEDQIGALICETEDGQTIRCSGMTDERRQHMTSNWEEYYQSQMCEIKHFGRVGQDGSGYRHPQFLRMRSDLDH